MKPSVPTLDHFLAQLDACDSVLTDEAVAKVLDESGCDLADEFAVIDALCARAIQPSQVDDLQNATRIALAFRSRLQEPQHG